MSQSGSQPFRAMLVEAFTAQGLALPSTLSDAARTPQRASAAPPLPRTAPVTTASTSKSAKSATLGRRLEPLHMSASSHGAVVRKRSDRAAPLLPRDPDVTDPDIVAHAALDDDARTPDRRLPSPVLHEAHAAVSPRLALSDPSNDAAQESMESAPELDVLSAEFSDAYLPVTLGVSTTSYRLSQHKPRRPLPSVTTSRALPKLREPVDVALFSLSSPPTEAVQSARDVEHDVEHNLDDAVNADLELSREDAPLMSVEEAVLHRALPLHLFAASVEAEPVPQPNDVIPSSLDVEIDLSREMPSASLPVLFVDDLSAQSAFDVSIVSAVALDSDVQVEPSADDDELDSLESSFPSFGAMALSLGLDGLDDGLVSPREPAFADDDLGDFDADEATTAQVDVVHLRPALAARAAVQPLVVTLPVGARAPSAAAMWSGVRRS